MGYEVENTAMISFVTGAAFLVVAFISPLLSGIADFVGNKKNFMQFFVYLGSFSCVGLYWFDLDNLYLGLLFYFLAMIGLWASLVFYNSYLPDVAFPEQQDRASARGYFDALGPVYVMARCITMQAMRYSFVSVGIWWLGFSQVSFYAQRE